MGCFYVVFIYLLMINILFCTFNDSTWIVLILIIILYLVLCLLAAWLSSWYYSWLSMSFYNSRSSEEDHVLKKINELKNFNNVWLSTENFAYSLDWKKLVRRPVASTRLLAKGLLQQYTSFAVTWQWLCQTRYCLQAYRYHSRGRVILNLLHQVGFKIGLFEHFLMGSNTLELVFRLQRTSWTDSHPCMSYMTSYADLISNFATFGRALKLSQLLWYKNGNGNIVSRKSVSVFNL